MSRTLEKVILGQGYLFVETRRSLKWICLTRINQNPSTNTYPLITACSIYTVIKMERIKNEHIKEIMGVKGKPDIIDIIEKKRLQWYGHVKRMPEERIPKLIMEWVPLERRKRGRPRKT